MSFLFSDLMNLPHTDGNRISFNELKSNLPNTPDAVLRDVYSDHGRKAEFQTQYGRIAIDALEWNLVNYKAKQIIQCTAYSLFELGRLIPVSRWIDNFGSKGWSCIDTRQEVVEQWKLKQTWLSPPYLLQGKILGKKSDLHLVEGHTRLGILKGLVNQGLVEEESLHMIWYGRLR